MLPRCTCGDAGRYSCRLEGKEELEKHCTELDALVEIVHAWRGTMATADGERLTHTSYRNYYHPSGAARGDMVGNHNWHYEAGLPFPFVHYPRSYGTFIGYSEDVHSKIYLCSCVEKAVENYMLINKKPGTWPKDFSLGLDPHKAEYREGICHKCMGLKPGLIWCSPMYLSKSERSYGWYTKQAFYRAAVHPMMREATVEHRKAVRSKMKEEAKQSLGIRTGSKGENDLYQEVCRAYPGEDIIRNWHPDWLEGLELDVYLPGRKLAFEYQGEQHYRPVAHWGGEENLAAQKERDEKKRRLCQENGVRLVEVPHGCRDIGKTIAATINVREGGG